MDGAAAGDLLAVAQVASLNPPVMFHVKFPATIAACWSRSAGPLRHDRHPHLGLPWPRHSARAGTWPVQPGSGLRPSGACRRRNQLRAGQASTASLATVGRAGVIGSGCQVPVITATTWPVMVVPPMPRGPGKTYHGLPMDVFDGQAIAQRGCMMPDEAGSTV